MRTYAALQVLCTFDLDQVQEAFDQSVSFDDTDPVSSSTVQSGLVILAPSIAAQQFQFGSVSAAATLLVIAYDAVQVHLGSSSAPAIDVIPVPATSAAAVTSVHQRQDQPGVAFVRGKVSSLFLSNPSSSSPARAFVAVVGDAV